MSRKQCFYYANVDDDNDEHIDDYGDGGTYFPRFT